MVLSHGESGYLVGNNFLYFKIVGANCIRPFVVWANAIRPYNRHCEERGSQRRGNPV